MKIVEMYVPRNSSWEYPRISESLPRFGAIVGLLMRRPGGEFEILLIQFGWLENDTEYLVVLGWKSDKQALLDNEGELIIEVKVVMYDEENWIRSLIRSVIEEQMKMRFLGPVNFRKVSAPSIAEEG